MSDSSVDKTELIKELKELDVSSQIENLEGLISDADESSIASCYRDTSNPEDVAKKPTRTQDDDSDIRTKIADMVLPEKLKLAMFGNAVCRGLLIGDANKMIQMCVLKNPKLRLPEVEEFSKNPNVSDMVLRKIANTREWMKSYMIKLNLVTNPKTPQDISLKWIKYLRTSDLKKLSKSKNIPNVIAVSAKKRLAQAK